MFMCLFMDSRAYGFKGLRVLFLLGFGLGLYMKACVETVWLNVYLGANVLQSPSSL